MAVEPDTYPPYQDYAHPQRLVSPSWLSARLGQPGLHVIECNEDELLYNIGHLPSAMRISPTDLVNSVTRDIIGGQDFAALMSRLGIERDDTIVFYGDRSNRWACFALWVCELFGHPDSRLLDGGRDAWMAEERDTSFSVPVSPISSNYPVCERNDADDRMFVSELASRIASAQETVTGNSSSTMATVVDVRSAAEFSGTNSPASALRGGHIPGATHISWQDALRSSGAFRSRTELNDLWTTSSIAVYSQVGGRAALMWFVAKFLVGDDDVRVYDGGWSEWGNMVAMPIAADSEAAAASPEM